MRSKSVRIKQQNLIDNVSYENQHEIISDMVTPFWKISYEDELKIKQKMSEDAVQQIFLKTSKNTKMTDRRIVSDIIASVSRYFDS